MSRTQNVLKRIYGVSFVLVTILLALPVVSTADHINPFEANPFKIRFSSETLQLAATVKKKPAKKSIKQSSRVRGADFDHLATGYPLSGAHNRAECSACHVSGVFKGTPTSCASCHDLGRARASTKKPSNHIQAVGECSQCHNNQTWTGARFDHATVVPGNCITCHNGSTTTGHHGGHVSTNASCDACHTTRAWIPATYDHNQVAPGTCLTCHNGGTASGLPGGHLSTNESCDVCHSTNAWLPANLSTFDHSTVVPGTCITCHNGSTAPGHHGGHMRTNESCDACHTTRAWIPAIVDHSTVAPGTCITCHNGGTASGLPGGHVATGGASCDTCHTTRGWIPASFDHSQVAPGTCLTCHNGGTASGLPGGHVATSASCDACHSTNAWLPASYDHSAVAPGTCNTCHNGGTASGLPGGHFGTSRSCDDCHRLPPSGWTPTKRYQHTSGFYPGDHNSGVTCNKCHKANSEVIVFENTAYLPFCASCHGLKFLTEDHEKVKTPKLIYLLNDQTHNVKDCRAACHEYEDTTFTTILKTRNNKHNVRDGGW